MNDVAPGGHIKLARKAFDADYGDAFWLERREFSRFEAWIDVIQLAAFKAYRQSTTHFGVIDLLRGEFVASLRWLAARWCWSVKRVRTWIENCEKGARIKAQRETQAGTVYLIVNYETYQGKGHSEGTRKGTPEDTPGAHQGHKIEAGKASKAETPIASDVQLVLDRFVALHPRRRVGKKDPKVVAAALALGYTPSELIEAVEGNAGDEWHIEKAKHELSYVLRDGEKIDTFRAKWHASKPRLAVDPITGLPNVTGMQIIGRKAS